MQEVRLQQTPMRLKVSEAVLVFGVQSRLMRRGCLGLVTQRRLLAGGVLGAVLVERDGGLYEVIFWFGLFGPAVAILMWCWWLSLMMNCVG